MSNPPSELRIRQAVRALIITPETQVLLVRFEFPAGTRWALPGGGLDPGEDHVAALRRELVEEVGLHHADIGPHIWTREHQIPFINGQWDGQREHIHLNFYDYSSGQPVDLAWCPISTIKCPEGFRRPDLILDVNTPEQYEFMRQLYEYLYPRNPQFHIIDTIQWYDLVYKRLKSKHQGNSE